MHDHIRKYCLCFNVFAVWIKLQMSEPFRFYTIPVIFAIYIPTGER